MIRITNGKIVTPDDVLEGFDLIIENDIIKDIITSGAEY
jgi:N-acetylglucosamine-6-phosphate deacetylase